MLIQIICISILMLLLQFFFYKRNFHKLTLYILPIVSLCYMVYSIFKIVRAQALVNTSFPLAIKVIGMLLPIMISLIGMIVCIVIKYRHVKKSELKKVVLRQFLGFLVVMFVILSVTIYSAQEYVIFFPNDSEQDRETLQQSHTYKQVTISQKYKGWLKENDNSDTIIVYFGGNAQNTASTFLQFESVGIFDVMKNYSFLSIDYPSYGESEGSLSQDSLFEMADDVMEYVDDHFPDKKVDLIGYSIGTGIASYVADHHALHKFVLVAPYNNGKDLFNTYFSIFYGPLTNLIHYPLASDQYVKQVTCDSLVVMSKADSIVPMKLSKRLIKAFQKEPATVVYEKDTHADLITEVKPWKDIIAFLDK